VEGASDRQSLLSAVRHAVPTATGGSPKPRYRDRAVFWGTGRDTTVSPAVQ
jgi:hypothetical protein